MQNVTAVGSGISKFHVFNSLPGRWVGGVGLSGTTSKETPAYTPYLYERKFYIGAERTNIKTRVRKTESL